MLKGSTLGARHMTVCHWAMADSLENIEGWPTASPSACARAEVASPPPGTQSTCLYCASDLRAWLPSFSTVPFPMVALVIFDMQYKAKPPVPPGAVANDDQLRATGPFQRDVESRWSLQSVPLSLHHAASPAG